MGGNAEQPAAAEDESLRVGNAQQPAGDQRVPEPPRLAEYTPLFSQFTQALDAVEAEDILSHTQRFCFAGDLCFATPSGHRLPEPPPLSRELEDLLRICIDRRASLARANAWRASDFCNRVATEEECRCAVNAWRSDVESWMHSRTLALYEEASSRLEAHQLAKSRFSTYLFHLSGYKFLLKALIMHPVIAGLASRDRAV